MRQTRRQFTGLGAAAVFEGLLGCRKPAARPTTWLLAPWEPALSGEPGSLERHLVSLYHLGEARTATLDVPFFGHSVVLAPGRLDRAMLFGKNQTIAARLELGGSEPRVSQTIEASKGRAFYGHGAMSPDGKLLYATELDMTTGEGALVTRDAESLRVVGEVESHGKSPHECLVLDGGMTMLIVNAGHKPECLGSCLAWVDIGSGRLLRKLENPNPAVHLTHLARANDGTVIVASAPTHGRPQAPGAVFAARAEGPLTPIVLPDEIAMAVHDEVLSVVISERSHTAAVTIPEGNLVIFIELSTLAIAGTLSLDRPAGIGLSPDGNQFIVGARRSFHFVDVSSRREAAPALQGIGSTSHLVVASGEPAA